MIHRNINPGITENLSWQLPFLSPQPSSCWKNLPPQLSSSRRCWKLASPRRSCCLQTRSTHPQRKPSPIPSWDPETKAVNHKKLRIINLYLPQCPWSSPQSRGSKPSGQKLPSWSPRPQPSEGCRSWSWGGWWRSSGSPRPRHTERWSPGRSPAGSESRQQSWRPWGTGPVFES